MSIAVQSATAKLTNFARNSTRSGQSMDSKKSRLYNHNLSLQPNNQQKHHIHHQELQNNNTENQQQQVQSRSLVTMFAVIVLALMLASAVDKVRANSLAATLNSLAANQQGGLHRQLGSYGHYDEQQLVKKFMPELILQAQTDRPLERALLNMLMNQRIYNSDESQQQPIGGLTADSRALQGLDSIVPNQISGYDPGKRSYWKQCAVNAVSCFGRRKRR